MDDIVLSSLSVRIDSGWGDMVRRRLTLTNIEDWRVVVDVRTSYCRNPKLVDTIVHDLRFVKPEGPVEVEADATVVVSS